MFHDANNNAKLDAGEAVLTRQEALPKGVRLIGNQPVASYVSYTLSSTTNGTRLVLPKFGKVSKLSP